ncbi:50S ribosomal protein L10 [Candidatus Marsarchaeota archaeon]|nr:50S ribosomal protein L10 [Candidatus Marsarchaeota archaeon]
MLTLEQKKKFVEEHVKLIDSYKLVGIVPLSGIPDRLLQSSRNSMRSEVKFITGKKSLLVRVLEGSKNGKELAKMLDGTCAILLSNSNPFEIYNRFASSSIKLAAKPQQIAPADIEIKGGETTLQPGQAVTELKSAGIDVKIDKGKVVISKDKVIVPKGGVISLAVAKALHTLDIMPFKASIEPSLMLSEGLRYTKDVFSINAESVSKDIANAFASALAISYEGKMVNRYTIERFIANAYNEAMALGVEGKVPDTGIMEKLVEMASLPARAPGGNVKE